MNTAAAFRVKLFLTLPFMLLLLGACSLRTGGETPYGRIYDEAPYSIAGLPQQEFTLTADYENGRFQPIYFAGTCGYVIAPRGPVDPERRWIWISPMWLVVRSSAYGDMHHKFYVESFLQAGFHVVGIDVGTSLGSPAGAAVYQQFYELLTEKFRLHPKARLVGQSNGGLIAYGWAFRHPHQVDRVFGILPATDMRSWPGMDKVTGPGAITPAGLAYPLTPAEMDARLAEFNAIDNLKPLATAGVRILHLHGNKDELVPMDKNSTEFVRRYRALGGDAELIVLEGLPHGGQVFYESNEAVRFLVE